jgi:DnaJ-class molecular chaperone
MRWRELTHGYEDKLAVLASQSPHEVLGVAHDCSPEQLKAAYLRLVKSYHPDKADPFMARHNEEVLKLINAAYERLTKAATR